MNELSVIDLFCGAGGFSEGFRQQGFKVILGVDNYLPAIETFNHNFKLNCPLKNILEFEYSVDQIEALPDSDVIIGSPPCVSFSHSNNSGKANKDSGIRLTKIFLRIVAVKKFKENSKLKGWFMENVVNSKNYLNEYYTFKDLGLADWAIKRGFTPKQKAIQLRDNQIVINSADYGVCQKRKRLFSGEIIPLGHLSVPAQTHGITNSKEHLTLSDIIGKLPRPNSSRCIDQIRDPLYPDIAIKLDEITDHFYDTGLYECVWRQSKHLKVNHPYMGKMSFPEDETKPSRTITATNIGTSREAIIYKSEFNRVGNGEFRTPTVREAATLMGFPFTYQFKGSEGTKMKLVGNAVCPPVSRAFARQLRIELKLLPVQSPLVNEKVNLVEVGNLNTFLEKTFDKRPRRIKGSRFRRHPFKDGNITVTLSNYDINSDSKKVNKWITSVQYGNGEGFPTFNVPDGTYVNLEGVVSGIKGGSEFIAIMNNGFTEKIAKADILQKMYEAQDSIASFLEPTKLIEEVARMINELELEGVEFLQKDKVIFVEKTKVPAKQLFALYALNKITSIANN